MNIKRTSLIILGIILLTTLTLTVMGYRLGEKKAIRQYYHELIKSESLFPRGSQMAMEVDPQKGLQEDVEIIASTKTGSEKMVAFKIEKLKIVRAVSLKSRLGLFYKVVPPENELYRDIQILLNTGILNVEADEFLYINNQNNVRYVAVEKITIEESIINRKLDIINSLNDINRDDDNVFVFTVEKGTSINHIESIYFDEEYWENTRYVISTFDNSGNLLNTEIWNQEAK